MTLAETQALFHEALTRPEAVDPARITACFAGTDELPALDRVAIYQDMYRWRLVDALRETFPKLALALGDERFAPLAGAYLRRHPSEHHDIARVGRELAAFLRAFPDPGRPDLGDLAELEWARQEAFFAAAAPPAGPEVLAGLAPEAFARTSLSLAPSLRLVRLDHAATALWRDLEDGRAPAPPAPGPAAVAVWRPAHEVVHAALPLDEAEALRLALLGRPLAAVCEPFAGRGDQAEGAHAALSSWLEEGWITGTLG